MPIFTKSIESKVLMLQIFRVEYVRVHVRVSEAVTVDARSVFGNLCARNSPTTFAVFLARVG